MLYKWKKIVFFLLLWYSFPSFPFDCDIFLCCYIEVSFLHGQSYFFLCLRCYKINGRKSLPHTKLEKDIKTETGRYTLYVCTYTHIYSSHSKISTFLSLASSSFKWAVPCISFQGLFKALPQGRLRVPAQGHPFRCRSRRGVASRYSLGLPAQNSQPHHFPCSPGPSFSRSGGSPPPPCTCSPALSQAPNTAFSASSVAGSMLVLGAPRKSQKHVAEGVFQGYLRARWGGGRKRPRYSWILMQSRAPGQLLGKFLPRDLQFHTALNESPVGPSDNSVSYYKLWIGILVLQFSLCELA